MPAAGSQLGGGLQSARAASRVPLSPQPPALLLRALRPLEDGAAALRRAHTDPFGRSPSAAPDQAQAPLPAPRPGGRCRPGAAAALPAGASPSAPHRPPASVRLSRARLQASAAPRAAVTRPAETQPPARPRARPRPPPPPAHIHPHEAAGPPRRAPPGAGRKRTAGGGQPGRTRGTAPPRLYGALLPSSGQRQRGGPAMPPAACRSSSARPPPSPPRPWDPVPGDASGAPSIAGSAGWEWGWWAPRAVREEESQKSPPPGHSGAQVASTPGAMLCHGSVLFLSRSTSVQTLAFLTLFQMCFLHLSKGFIPSPGILVLQGWFRKCA